MTVEITDKMRKALEELSIHDPKTYVLTTESLVQGRNAEAVCKKYQISKTAFYERLKKGKAFLLDRIKHPFAETRADAINKKFPKLNGRH